MESKKSKYTAGANKRQQKSDLKNCRRFTLKLSYSTDGDIIDKLEQVANIQGYIKELILNDLKN